LVSSNRSLPPSACMVVCPNMEGADEACCNSNAGSAVFYGRARDAHALTDINKWLHLNVSVSKPLLLLGETDAAVEVLESAMKKAAASRALGGPLTDSMFAGVNPEFVQTYLFALCTSSKTRDQVSEAHMEFGKLVRTLTGPLNPCVVEDKDPSRRLKIGYLSGNLHHHVVSDCLEGVLRAHDREAVHVTTYQRNSKVSLSLSLSLSLFLSLSLSPSLSLPLSLTFRCMLSSAQFTRHATAATLRSLSVSEQRVTLRKACQQLGKHVSIRPVQHVSIFC
jgi:hypothetical protein